MGLQGFCVKKGGRDCRSRSPGVCSSDDVFRLEFFEDLLAVHFDPDAVARQGVDADEPDRLREEADFRISLPTAEELDAGVDLFPGFPSVETSKLRIRLPNRMSSVPEPFSRAEASMSAILSYWASQKVTVAFFCCLLVDCMGLL